VRSWLSALVAIGASLFLALAALRNLEPVQRVDWIFGSASGVPLWCVLGVSLLLGAGLSGLVFSIPAVRLGLRLRRAERRIAQLEREVHGLRTLPLDEAIRDAGRDS
jgi:hypothetical protein